MLRKAQIGSMRRESKELCDVAISDHARNGSALLGALV
jgi:hypothetical protein